MKIITVYQSQLNSIMDGLGTAITENLPFYKDRGYILLHQTSINELMAIPFPDMYKHGIGMLIQLMNINGYSVMQILKS